MNHTVGFLWPKLMLTAKEKYCRAEFCSLCSANERCGKRLLYTKKDVLISHRVPCEGLRGTGSTNTAWIEIFFFYIWTALL